MAVEDQQRGQHQAQHQGLREPLAYVGLITQAHEQGQQQEELEVDGHVPDTGRQGFDVQHVLQQQGMRQDLAPAGRDGHKALVHPPSCQRGADHGQQQGAEEGQHQALVAPQHGHAQ